MLQKRGSNATYDRRCLHLTDEEVARRVKNGQKSVIRLHVRPVVIYCLKCRLIRPEGRVCAN